MILGVLSDTHSLILSPQLMEGLAKADIILHAGDICDATVLATLRSLAPVKAVQGNMDEPSLKKRLPIKEIIEVDGVKVGMTHGHVGMKDACSNAQEQFKDTPVDIIIFGHSHQPLNEKHGKMLLFNPGSPNDVVRAPYFSYGRIEIKGGKIKAEIVKI